MFHKRTQHATEHLSSPHRGQLKIHIHTRPNVADDQVTYYLVRHGHKHKLGVDITNSNGNAKASFHKTPGKKYKVKTKVFATGSVKHDYTPTKKIRIKS